MIKRLLRRADFRNFWLGQTISVFGDQITLLAIPIVAVLILDADPAQMGPRARRLVLAGRAARRARPSSAGRSCQGMPV